METLMSTPPVYSTPQPLDPREVLTSNIDVIRRIVRTVAYRQRMTVSAAEELESSVWVRLIEHDYRAIRQYKGQASFGTFLTVIVSRLALDVQSAEWGRWRPSSRARRLGATAALFETLVFRDGYSREEAAAHMAATGLEAPTQAVRELASKSRSMPRRYIPVDLLANTLAGGDDPSAPLASSECRHKAHTVGRALRAALQSLSPGDRLLLRMRHEQGLKITTIARVVGEDQKSLYRRLALLHRRLRRRIVAAGVSSGDALEVIGRCDVRWPGVISPTQTVAA